MATIGNFKLTGETYSGKITTLSLKANVAIVPTTKSGEKAPDFRLYSDACEIGAAWKKTSKQEKPYLAVTLDDPSFANAIQARLVANDNGDYDLFWNR